MVAEGTPVMMSDGCGMGGGSWIWAFLIFALLGFGGNGMVGRAGDYRTPATTEDLMMNSQFGNLDRQVNAISDRQFTQANGLTKGICELGYTMATQNNATQSLVSSESRALATQLADCCCTTQRGIDGINYNGAMNTAAINANTTAVGQKILDALCQNKIESLQGQVNQLQLQNAMSGVVRYPNAWTYNAGTSPFCGCCNGVGVGYYA